MNAHAHSLAIAAGLSIALSAVPAAFAQAPSGREIVDRVETLLWGKTVQGEYEMTITTPRWQRELAAVESGTGRTSETRGAGQPQIAIL